MAEFVFIAMNLLPMLLRLQQSGSKFRGNDQYFRTLGARHTAESSELIGRDEARIRTIGPSNAVSIGSVYLLC